MRAQSSMPGMRLPVGEAAVIDGLGDSVVEGLPVTLGDSVGDTLGDSVTLGEGV